MKACERKSFLARFSVFYRTLSMILIICHWGVENAAEFVYKAQHPPAAVHIRTKFIFCPCKVHVSERLNVLWIQFVSTCIDHSSAPFEIGGEEPAFLADSFRLYSVHIKMNCLITFSSSSAPMVYIIKLLRHDLKEFCIAGSHNGTCAWEYAAAFLGYEARVSVKVLLLELWNHTSRTILDPEVSARMCCTDPGRRNAYFRQDRLVLLRG